ncbi:MAG TPA: hypothetical protein VK983_04120, partial [Candidatus Limnocylindrales bacterium]|nr:hypothetical protein [Candidatus Limnocylindrales bacterium]
MTTQERLRQYYPFTEEIVGQVADAALRQNRKSFQELADQYGIADGPQIVEAADGKHTLEVLSVIPQQDYDASTARVYHTPMANPVSPNMAMRALRLFGSDPSVQLLVIGNPSIPGHGAGKTTLKESLAMMRSGSLEACVAPVVSYLGKRAITKTQQLGYSYGADKAVATTRHASDRGIGVTHGVYIEPASAVKRRMPALAKAFSETNEPMARYIQQTESEPYSKVREQDSALGLVGYAAGLLRVSNIAIATTIKQGGFIQRVDEAMKSQEDLEVTVGWGSLSELAPDDAMTQVVAELQSKYGAQRI